jgi:uncharacterized protein (TIGR03086 family)
MKAVASDPIAVAERAYGLAGKTIAGVRPEQLDDPTPCSEWTVRNLITHMIGAQVYFAAALRGREVDPYALPDFTAGDPASKFREAAAETLSAWREPGVFDRTVQTLMGPLPASMLVGMLSMDNLVHAWDLARATGQDETLDSDLAAPILVMIRQVNPPRGEGSPFGPEQLAPEGATPVQELVAYLGRRV